MGRQYEILYNTKQNLKVIIWGLVFTEAREGVFLRRFLAEKKLRKKAETMAFQSQKILF